MPLKVKVCGWRVCFDILPPRFNLIKKMATLENSCPLCNMEGKTTNHVLRECSFSHAVWFTAPLGLGLVLHSHGSIKEWLYRLVEEKQVNMDVVQILVSSLWIERRKLVWEGTASNLMDVV